MSQASKIETAMTYSFFAIPVLGLLSMASLATAGVLLGLGLVAATLYVLADN